MVKSQKIITSLFDQADIQVNGSQPHDIQVHNNDFYRRVLNHGSLGLGESYMEGWWDCKHLDQFFYKIISADLGSKVSNNMHLLSHIAWGSLINMGRKSKAFEIGKRHYDIGNDLYQKMLGKRMVYTCGYWQDATTLDEAQDKKLDLVCRKIGLKRGQTVLDIGSGWGSFLGFAAEKYGADATGVTVSKKQKELSDKFHKKLTVKTRLQDYRDIKGKFDHVVSLGMLEHVGSNKYREFMNIAHRSLKDDGLFLLHTIGINRSVTNQDPWILKYIFPNSMLPSVKQLGQSIEGLFVMEDWHNFGSFYDNTLMAWHENFTSSWDTIKANYDDKFYRMWRYYLLSFAGSFRARNIQLWQIVLSKKGVKGGYQSIR